MGKACPAAARILDPIAHSNALGGLLEGAIIGGLLVVGAILEVFSGGMATPLLVLAVAGIGADVGLAAGVGEFVGSLEMDTTGYISGQGSRNIFINDLSAIRASLDVAICNQHGPSPVPIVEGSGTVFFNNRPAVRVGNICQCSARVDSGSLNVFIGGETVRTVKPEEITPEVPEPLEKAVDFLSLPRVILEKGAAVAAASYGGSQSLAALTEKYATDEWGEGTWEEKAATGLVNFGSGPLIEHTGGEISSRIKGSESPMVSFVERGAPTEAPADSGTKSASPASEENTNGDGI